MRRIRWQQGILNLSSLGLALLLFLACASPAFAQKDKKKKKEAAAAESVSSVIPMTDEQQIDYLISEMLGAWQLGDIEKLHKHYADDVSLVNGAWAPPVIGWQSFLASYNAQRARMQQVRLDRTNTYIRVSGNVGWASYQWDFAAAVDGQPSTAQGHTTLVMQKRDNHWVIVHNHTSIVQSATGGPANTTPPPPPSKPAGQ